MNNRKILSIALAAAVAFSALAGCGKPKAGNESSAAPVSSQVTVSSEAQSSSDPQSEAPVSSEPAAVKGNEPTESQPGPVITIQTDDKEFDKKFADNPIDKAYIKASNNAVSNIDMVNVSNQYSAIWQKEVTHAYAELTKKMAADSSQKPKELRAEQEKWLSEKDAALKKISDAALAAGGSMAQVNQAGGIMDYFRSRAAQIYRELYAYDKNYSYEYKSGS